MNKRLLTFALLLTKLSFSQGFQKLSPKETGIDFVNTILEDDTINGLSYLYLYNGGGVAIGDINNDGLEDIYFTGNQVDDKLYLNQGDLKFKDVTKKFFKNQRFDFHTGVTMVDINNDGWLDIYVSCAGPDYNGENRRNKLFINQEGKRFEDEAKEYGLDDSLNTTQAAFFDADGDGDLDCYLLNHIYNRQNTQYAYQFNKAKKVHGNDKLLMQIEGKFVDKTKESNILSVGYGLGLSITDINSDGHPDIYVTNDFDYPDKLFVNAGNGKFHERILQNTAHIPLFAMGVDAGDINNDGNFDLMVVDMASQDHVRSKKNMGGMSSKYFWGMVNDNRHYQYMFNTLQLNIGGKFIDIAQMAGVSKTDWSWSTFFADFNNDGYQDIYVANGYIRDIRDNDFKNQYDTIIKISEEFTPFEELSKLIPQSKLRDYIFMNNGDLTFSDNSVDMGILEKENVNGATYADLDNDGDLDIVCNEIDGLGFIRENKLNSSNNFIKIQLPQGIHGVSTVGAKLSIETKSNTYYREVQNTRGFQSSVSETIHVGLGGNNEITKILIDLKGRRYQLDFQAKVNKTYRIQESDLEEIEIEEIIESEIAQEVKMENISIEHIEINYDDFKKEVLLPHKMSQLGPKVLVSDVNGDGREDFYLSGARGMNGVLSFQNEDGSFTKDTNQLWKQNFHAEEVGGIFFDVDNDGDQDLYVVHGGNEAPVNHETYQDQLYLNDGRGNYSLGSGRLPELRLSGQLVIAEDLNKDGWTDLLVFGRQVPGKYPAPADAEILINHRGTFLIETENYTNEFKELGMVTDGLFVNVDTDEDFELIIVGEWMPITIFDWREGKLANVTKEKGMSQTVGWWNSIDLYSDTLGSANLICGNLGENNKFHPSVDKPFHIYMSDFDENGTNDIVLAKKQASVLYPVRGRQCSSEQMPFIEEKFPTYDQFACASVEVIYTQEKLDSALHYQAHTFSNSQLSIIKGEFQLKRLPSQLQTGPINDVIIKDFDKDGLKDMMCFGNKFEAEVETVRYDGNPGHFISGNNSFDQAKSLNLNLNIKSIATVTINNEEFIVLGVNDERVRVLKIQ